MYRLEHLKNSMDVNAPDSAPPTDGMRAPPHPLQSCALAHSEANLLWLPSDPYTRPGVAWESIMVHEFGHTVKNLGLDQPVQDGVGVALRASLSRRFAQLGSGPLPYGFSNPDEYFANMGQAWFKATARSDVTMGVASRSDVLVSEPELAGLFQRAAYGSNPWQYATDPDLPHSTAGTRRRELRPGVTVEGEPIADGEAGSTLAVPPPRFQVSREELEALAAQRRPEQVWVRP